MDMHNDYVALNSKINLPDDDGNLQLEADLQARDAYIDTEVTPNMVTFDTFGERYHYMINNKYWEKEVFDEFTPQQLEELYHHAENQPFEYHTLMAPKMFYGTYAQRTNNGKQILEHFHDRAYSNAIFLSKGNYGLAKHIIEEICSRRLQPATPTFLNAGRARRGAMTSCFLLGVDDNMESITRAITDSMQLSKRGGGVSLCLTNLRAMGDPIKKMDGLASGVVPVMKILEDSFKYVDQLGQRQGAGSVYLSAHHPDILTYLDTKKENADEAIRIKTLSIGVVIPDITYHLAKTGEKMALFSPHDVQKEYGVPFAMVDITKHYRDMVANPNIRKKYIDPRQLFSQMALMQFESGYPYILNIDNANKQHNNSGIITHSNLCSEILQQYNLSEFKESGEFKVVGEDISCNLASLNIANTMESPDFAQTIDTAVRALTEVTNRLHKDVSCSPTIVKGNDATHAIGLGQMNLHGYLAKNHIHYDTPEAINFVDVYFYTVMYHVMKTSNQIAKEKGEYYRDYPTSKYATGEFFEPLTREHDNIIPTIESETVAKLFEGTSIHIPTRENWVELQQQVQQHGLYHGYMQAVAPNGSISYINEATSSIHPVASPIEARKTGRTGRTYVPMPYLSMETAPYYRDAYTIGAKAIIDVYAASQKWVDQGQSLTLFYPNTASSRDVVKNYIYAWTKGIKTLYYARVKTHNLDGTGVETAVQICEACQL